MFRNENILLENTRKIHLKITHFATWEEDNEAEKRNVEGCFEAERNK
jgi:hypothetical protein